MPGPHRTRTVIVLPLWVLVPDLLTASTADDRPASTNHRKRKRERTSAVRTMSGPPVDVQSTHYSSSESSWV